MLALKLFKINDKEIKIKIPYAPLRECFFNYDDIFRFSE